jgi:hypothetical protein
MKGQDDTQISPSWFHISELTIHALKQGLQHTQIFIQLFLTGENK